MTFMDQPLPMLDRSDFHLGAPSGTGYCLQSENSTSNPALPARISQSPVKAKHLIALILVLIGTNLFTFACSRYWTTRHVLSQASERVSTVMEQQESGDTAPDFSSWPRIRHAIEWAGGRYYWWNDGLIYWGSGVVLILSGLAVTRYQPGPKVAKSPRT